MHTYVIEVNGKTMLVTDQICQAIRAYEAWNKRGQVVKVLSQHISDVTHIIGGKG